VAIVSINTMRETVISKLRNHFPSMTIYGEEIAEGFQKPCLFVKLFSVDQTQIIGNRYKRNHSFNIHYFSETEFPNDDMHAMAEQLYDLMEIIGEHDNLYRGTKMRHEIKEDVLHFFVNYNIVVNKEIEHVDEMEILAINGHKR